MAAALGCSLFGLLLSIFSGSLLRAWKLNYPAQAPRARNPLFAGGLGIIGLLFLTLPWFGTRFDAFASPAMTLAALMMLLGFALPPRTHPYAGPVLGDWRRAGRPAVEERVEAFRVRRGAFGRMMLVYIVLVCAGGFYQDHGGREARNSTEVTYVVAALAIVAACCLSAKCPNCRVPVQSKGEECACCGFPLTRARLDQQLPGEL